MNNKAATKPSDEALMEGMARGDIKDLELLYKRYRTAVLHFISAVLVGVSPADAEDVSQDVFLTLFKTASRYKERGTLRGWLFGIAVKKTRAAQRKQWRRLKLLKEKVPELAHLRRSTDTNPERTMLDREQISSLMGGITPRHREVLMMRMGEGLNGEEIALALGISRNSVFVRLHRAQQALAKAIENSGEDLDSRSTQ